MSDDSTTNAEASVSGEQELAQMEQAINATAEQEAEASGDSKSTQDSEAPKPQYGQAFTELAEKKGFKNPDDFIRSYMALESHKTRLEQERKELQAANKSQAPRSQDQQEDLPPAQRKALDTLERVVRKVVGNELAPIREDYETRRAGSEIEQVQQQYPNFKGPVIEEAVAYVEKHPSLSLAEAYKIVSYDTDVTIARTQGNRTAKAQSKKRAYTESASNAKTGSDLDYSKLSLEEMENILPKAGQFIDYKGKLRK